MALEGLHHITAITGDAPRDVDVYGRHEGGMPARPMPIVDLQYFHSVSFREPSGVLFELASRDVGLDVHEPRESLMLSPRYESRSEDLQARLTPIFDPRQTA